VDQVGEEGDGTGEGEDRKLDPGGEPEDGEARCDGLDARVRADDGAVDEAVRMRVFVVGVVMIVRVSVLEVVAQEASSIRSG
jgi:hypothetical protein